MKSNSQPPRIFDHIIEMMFPLAMLGGLNFDARLLSIQSIDDAECESGGDSEPDAATHECSSRGASHDKSCGRKLVRGDSRLAKKWDECGVDRYVELSRE